MHPMRSRARHAPGMAAAVTGAMNVKKVASAHMVTLLTDASVVDAAKVMREKHVGSIIIVDAESRPCGILTDRDIVVVAVAERTAELLRLTVGEVCTKAPLVAEEDEDTDAVLGRMCRHGVRRMPIVDREGRLRGVFALDDALGTIAEELGGIVALLRNERITEAARRGSTGQTP